MCMCLDTSRKRRVDGDDFKYIFKCGNWDLQDLLSYITLTVGIYKYIAILCPHGWICIW